MSTTTIQTSEKYGYNVDQLGAKFLIEIDTVIDGVAIAKAPSFDGLSQNDMTFDAHTGIGVGLYAGTFLSYEKVH